MIKSVILSVVALAAVVSAVPASATITTFAAFTPVSSDRNVRWVNGTNKFTTNQQTANSSSGFFYTTASPTANQPGIAKVNFELFQIPSLGMMPADFFMDVSVVNKPATAFGGFLFQTVLNGTFSFTSVNSFMVNSTFYAAGSNLLSATYTDAVIFGQANGTSGSFSGSSGSGTVVFTSDVLDFTNVIDTDFAMSLTSVNQVFFRASQLRALRTFRANTGGQFSSNPAPIISAIPEPEVWGLMVVGFGLVGVQVRRRSRQATIVA